MNKVESPENQDSIDIMELKSFNEVKHVDRYEDEENYEETGRIWGLGYVLDLLFGEGWCELGNG